MQMMLSHSQNSIPKWCNATLIARELVAADIVLLRFEIVGASYVRHIPGQYYDLRIVLPGGVVSERSYSIANVPNEKGIIEFGIQLIEDGEVSPFLWNLTVGDVIDMRGPSGNFVWNPLDPKFACKHLILIGGGSGMVPLMSMVRQYVEMKKIEPQTPGLCQRVYVVVSAKSIATIPYYEELERIASKFPEVNLTITVTGDVLEEWKGYTKRIDEEVLREVLGDTSPANARIYICGRNRFIDTITSSLVSIGYSLGDIRTERFG